MRGKSKSLFLLFLLANIVYKSSHNVVYYARNSMNIYVYFYLSNNCSELNILSVNDRHNRGVEQKKETENETRQ